MAGLLIVTLPAAAQLDERVRGVRAEAHRAACAEEVPGVAVGHPAHAPAALASARERCLQAREVRQLRLTTARCQQAAALQTEQPQALAQRACLRAHGYAEAE